MLSIRGPGARLCDQISRRAALQVGSLGLASLSLPQVFAAEKKAADFDRQIRTG